MIGLLKRQTAGYKDEPVPLGSYTGLTATLNAGVIGFLALNRHRLPERVSATDVALLALATHRIARVITRDKVTTWLRAPFTRYESEGDAPSEVNETPRGEGARRAIGELLSCPSCAGTWVAAGLTCAFVAAPRATRVVTALFAADAIAAALQTAYAAATTAETQLEEQGEEQDEARQASAEPRVTLFDATTQI
jgi:hypothetical protein